MRNEILDIKTGVFNALAHPLRLKILEKLRRGPCCVCKIMPYVNAEQSNVSHHLSILKNAGVVRAEKRGMEVWYEVTDQRIFEIIDKMDKHIVGRFKKRDALFKDFMKGKQFFETGL